jgi:acyl-CoA synthetase (AMP-forming)/AMP-acid ligase II
MKFFVSIQGTTGFPKATMTTHHMLVNNAINAGKGLELNTEVLYKCISYVDKIPVEEGDRPLSFERVQAEVTINILACNDNCSKYGTKHGRVLCI